MKTFNVLILHRKHLKNMVALTILTILTVAVLGAVYGVSFCVKKIEESETEIDFNE